PPPTALSPLSLHDALPIYPASPHVGGVEHAARRRARNSQDFAPALGRVLHDAPLRRGEPGVVPHNPTSCGMRRGQSMQMDSLHPVITHPICAMWCDLCRCMKRITPRRTKAPSDMSSDGASVRTGPELDERPYHACDGRVVR